MFKADPLFAPARAFELIQEADPKQCPQRRGIQSGLLVRLRRCAHRPLLPSILLANVQSLDNKVDENRDCNILCFRETMALSGYTVIAPTGINISLGRRRAGVYVS
jgi:hypothetical protein